MAPQAAQAEAAARAADLRGAEQRCAAAEAALRRERSQKGSAFQLQQVHFLCDTTPQPHNPTTPVACFGQQSAPAS